MGPLVAEAAEEGYTGRRTAAEQAPPFHGYRYRLLTSQGPAAKDGARDFLINGKIVGGFAVVAYPADYEASGVMTFIVNHDGVVYQRDLGEETEKAAKSMRAFNPGEGWKKVDPEVVALQP
jgi:hypothetical protein